MAREPVPTGAEHAGQLLRDLLLNRPDYRRRWQRLQQRRTASNLPSNRAVANVVAAHLVEKGLLPDAIEDPGRMLKDRIGRALAGVIVSPDTITMLVDAFEMSHEDESALREALTNPPPAGIRAPQPLPVRQRHRTLMLFEHRTIDAHGRAVAHHSTKTIRACEDRIDCYPCFLSPRTATVETIHEVRMEPPMMKILLPRPLLTGEDTVVEYRRTFLPQGEPDTEYRRVFHARAESVSIMVQFHGERLPRYTWWSTWDHYRAGTLVAEEPVALDSLHRVHRYFPALENVATGFRWAW
ncbi:hypothetical protein [Nonomuraea soli]|uniref:Uncharacterized protein n=1 Tax=Nonomuraea soli TaxID=1032476 RepID=A0A7W0HPB9_9ACTN|nr:hypothetical protein [Nonomuraea soli]MBA2890710.1 hypothetical protein [Nonomuraea soli]